MTEIKLAGTVSKVDRSIDRSKICPSLLRIFCNENHHHLPRDYEHGHTPENEIQIHTWLDATLAELTGLIKEIKPDARRRGTQFSFSIVTAGDSSNYYRLLEIGKTENGQKRADDHIQLINKHFHIGDYLDVAITYKKPEPVSQRYNRNTSGPIRSTQRHNHRDRPY